MARADNRGSSKPSTEGDNMLDQPAPWSIAQLAEGVRKPPGLIAAEEALGALIDREAKLRRQIGKLLSGRTEGSASAVDRQVMAIAAEQAILSPKLRAARRAVAEAKFPYAEKVADRLHQPMLYQIGRLLDAFATIGEAVEILNQINRETQRAGCEPQLPWFGQADSQLASRARRWQRARHAPERLDPLPQA
jgi:hypothetical protein